MAKRDVRVPDKAKKVKVIDESVFINAHHNLLHPPGQGRISHGIDFSQDSFIFCFEGWRGAGKTTAMTVFAIMLNWLLGMRLIGNYPIEYRLHKRDGKYVHVKAEPLDFQKLLTFDSDYDNSLILIDEAPDVISNMLAMSIKNRLVNIFVREIRKNGNSLFLGSQHFDLIDKSLRWQVDVIVGCQDASRKYGNYRMKRGACILLDFYDNSGMWTGKSYRELGYGDYRVPGKNSVLQLKLTPSLLWGDKTHNSVYDTFYQQDILESLRKATLKLDAIEITDGRDKPTSNEYLVRAVNVINEVMAYRDKAIYQRDFYKAMGALSGKEKLALAKLMKVCDVRKGQDSRDHYYDFTGFDMDRFVNANSG